MPADGHWGRIIGATDTVSPEKLAAGSIDASDDAVVAPEKQTSPRDQRRRRERRSLIDPVDLGRLPWLASVGPDGHGVQSHPQPATGAQDQVARNQRRANRGFDVLLVKNLD